MFVFLGFLGLELVLRPNGIMLYINIIKKSIQYLVLELVWSNLKNSQNWKFFGQKIEKCQILTVWTSLNGRAGSNQAISQESLMSCTCTWTFVVRTIAPKYDIWTKRTFQYGKITWKNFVWKNIYFPCFLVASGLETSNWVFPHHLKSWWWLH